MSKTPEEFAAEKCAERLYEMPQQFVKSLEYCLKKQMKTCYLAGYKAAQQWISVKERLPEDNLEVLFISQVYDGYFVGYKAAEGSYVDPEGNGLSVSNIQKYYTHWMPLPEAPKEEK